MDTTSYRCDDRLGFVNATRKPHVLWQVGIAPHLWYQAVGRPNAWVRFWQWVFFGWRWEPVPAREG